MFIDYHWSSNLLSACLPWTNANVFPQHCLVYVEDSIITITESHPFPHFSPCFPQTVRSIYIQDLSSMFIDLRWSPLNPFPPNAFQPNISSLHVQDKQNIIAQSLNPIHLHPQPFLSPNLSISNHSTTLTDSIPAPLPPEFPRILCHLLQALFIFLCPSHFTCFFQYRLFWMLF